ncbi:testis development-related protein [Clarias gariepinus]|uniref:testis development-related protein n=1 Tax=Clarias gariepinus TaxID=13013 RepID=UPI00234D4F1B|nr:testis development-related protein [Clarias gariepinus]
MFKRSKSEVLVDDETSEGEEDAPWHRERAEKDKEPEGTEEALGPSTKDTKAKKVKPKKDKGDKKLFPSQDDEHFLLKGVTVSHKKGSAKKSLEEEKEKAKAHSEKDRVQCLWDSITMTMRQITPNRKLDRMEGWEPPQLGEEAEGKKSEGEGKKIDSSPLSTGLSLSLPSSLTLPSWTGIGSEEDSSRYSSLSEPQATGPSQWAARARDKLAAVRRRSPGSQSESAWEGLK